MAVLLEQLLKMLLFMAVGFLLSYGQVLEKGESRVIARLLLYVVLPGAIVNSFNKPASAEGFSILWRSVLCGGVALLLAMLLSALLFRRDSIGIFAASFSNAGFMGIPLIASTLGEDAVFYIAGMVALLNALQWTYGQAILSGERVKNTAGVLKNPMVIAFFTGVLLYCLPVELPGLAAQCLAGIAACNTPLAMIVLGLYLGDAGLKSVVANRRSYLVSAVRLLVIPLATMLVFKLLPFASYEIRLAVLIAACAPVGSNVAVYVQKLNMDNAYATSTVCCSTVISVLTIPLVISAAQAVW